MSARSSPPTRPPEIYDHVEAPEGEVCQRFVVDGDGHAEPCLADAEFLVVYEGNLLPDEDRRKNVLTCRDCAPMDLDGDRP